MKFKIICIGKLKEHYLKEGVKYYSKGIEVIELKDESIRDKASEKEKLQILNKEGNKIIEKIKKDEFVIILDIKGREIKNNELKEKIKSMELQYKKVTFIIGGSLGLSDEVKKRSNYKISYSKMTFPHQLMRLVLMEEISKLK